MFPSNIYFQSKMYITVSKLRNVKLDRLIQKTIITIILKCFLHNESQIKLHICVIRSKLSIFLNCQSLCFKTNVGNIFKNILPWKTQKIINNIHGKVFFFFAFLMILKCTFFFLILISSRTKLKLWILLIFNNPLASQASQSSYQRRI